MSKNISLNFVISVQLYLMKHMKKGRVSGEMDTEYCSSEKNNKIGKRSNVTIRFFILPNFELGVLLGNGRPARLGPSQSCQGITVLPCSLQGVRSGPQLPRSGMFDLARHFWGQTKS